MATAPSSPGWASRLHAACEWVTWTAAVNALWWLFTAAGLVVAGAAPATTTVTALTRRRLRGEAFPLVRTFAATWLSELRSANAVLLPPYALAAALVSGLLWLPAAHPAQAIASGIALAVVCALIAIVVPLYAEYDLPLRAYVPTAMRWGVRNLAAVAVLLLVPIVIGTGLSLLPGAAPFFGVGLLLTLNTAVGGAAFAANERALADSPT